MLNQFDNDFDARSNGNSSNAREGVHPSSGTRPTKTGQLSANGRPGGRVFEMSSTDRNDPSGASFDQMAERNQMNSFSQMGGDDNIRGSIPSINTNRSNSKMGQPSLGKISSALPSRQSAMSVANADYLDPKLQKHHTGMNN